MIAAEWLVQGWDSDALVELAGLSRSEAQMEARRLLPSVLESLGFDTALMDLPPPPACRYAERVCWAVRAMNGPFTPYSAAEKILEMVEDRPGVFDGQSGLAELRTLVNAYTSAVGEQRRSAQDSIREHLYAVATSLRVVEEPRCSGDRRA